MDLGATICAPRTTACMLCPIQPGCLATRQGDPTIYPVKPGKAERPVRKGHAYVMRDADGDVYLQSRPAKGLLGGMTEVPGSDWAAELGDVAYPAAGDWKHRGQVVHIFTHFRLELEVWSATVDPHGLDGGWWAGQPALAGEALPTLFRKVLAVAGLDQARCQAPELEKSPRIGADGRRAQVLASIPIRLTPPVDGAYSHARSRLRPKEMDYGNQHAARPLAAAHYPVSRWRSR
jgi:hypothetical protein